MKRLIIFLFVVPLCGFSQTINSIAKVETVVMNEHPWRVSHVKLNDVPLREDFPEGVTEVTHRKSESLHPEVSIYPVIAVDKVTIYRTTDIQAQYKIVSYSGEVVLQGILRLPSEEIIVTSLPKDSYWIEVIEPAVCTWQEFRK